jgi:hypothetical protein
VFQGTVEEIRAGYNGLLAMLAPQIPKPSDAVSTKDGEVDGIKYRVYTPIEASKSGPLPVGVYTHGGGLVLGDLDGEDICMKISRYESCVQLTETSFGQCAGPLPNIPDPLSSVRTIVWLRSTRLQPSLWTV